LVFRGGGRTIDREGAPAANGDEEEAEEKPKAKGKGRDPKKEYHEGSLDVVCMLNDSHFLSGGDSGSVIQLPSCVMPY
jgi:ribosomal RNA-processing protein 9